MIPMPPFVHRFPGWGDEWSCFGLALTSKILEKKIDGVKVTSQSRGLSQLSQSTEPSIPKHPQGISSIHSTLNDRDWSEKALLEHVNYRKYRRIQQQVKFIERKEGFLRACEGHQKNILTRFYKLKRRAHSRRLGLARGYLHIRHILHRARLFFQMEPHSVIGLSDFTLSVTVHAPFHHFFPTLAHSFLSYLFCAIHL